MSTNRSETELESAVREVVDAVRFATSYVAKPEDKYLRNLKGDCLSRPFGTRELPVSGMISLLHDAFKKGKPEAELLEVPEALSKAIRGWYRTQESALDIDLAHLYEERAEAKVEVAEAESRISPSGQVVKKLRLAHRAHIIAREHYITAVESKAAS
jgi:hypothetical protein